ncbi:gas vesicle protein GvpG [Kitasatospora sp. NPDC004240]
MGLIAGLLTLPLAFARGAVWVAGRLSGRARTAARDGPAALHRQLDEVEAGLRAGTITEEEAARREAELVKRLWEIRRPGGGRKV